MTLTIPRDLLVGVKENVDLFVERNRYCPFCDSVPHPDGHISHDEDCSVPEVEAALK